MVNKIQDTSNAPIVSLTPSTGVASSVESTLSSNTPIFGLETITHDESSAMICLERGGTVPSLKLHGVEIFYNDPDRRNNILKNIREGFWMGPVAGNMPPETQEELGYNLKQHGFLRNVARNQIKNNNSKVTYEYINSPGKDTFRQFPYHIKLMQTIEISKDQAIFTLEIDNLDDKIIPFAPGHHTYYEVMPKDKEGIEIIGLSELTEEDKIAWVSGDKTIMVKNSGKISLKIPGKPLYTIEYDDSFEDLWLWSEKGKGFVCVEPVVTHASNFTKNSLQIEPGESQRLSFTIQAT